MANIRAQGKNRITDLYLAYGDLMLKPFGIRFKPAPPPFDPTRRPPGWAGHWSAAYGRLLAYTFTEDPPFSKPAREVISNAPRPLQEALEPLSGSAELIDRNGRALPWQWSRSLTADLLGPVGVALAVLCLAAALGGLTISLFKLPSLMAGADPLPPTSRPVTEPIDAPLLTDSQPPSIKKTPAQSNEQGKSSAPGNKPRPQKAPPGSPTGKPRG